MLFIEILKEHYVLWNILLSLNINLYLGSLDYSIHRDGLIIMEDYFFTELIKIDKVKIRYDEGNRISITFLTKNAVFFENQELYFGKSDAILESSFDLKATDYKKTFSFKEQVYDYIDQDVSCHIFVSKQSDLMYSISIHSSVIK